MTPSRMATSFFTAIRIRVKSLFYVLHASGAMAAAVLPAYAAQAVILVIATAQVVILAATDNSRFLGNPTYFPLLLQLAAPSSPPTRPSPAATQAASALPAALGEPPHTDHPPRRCGLELFHWKLIVLFAKRVITTGGHR
jgi:hypothetical protein